MIVLRYWMPGMSEDVGVERPGNGSAVCGSVARRFA